MSNQTTLLELETYVNFGGTAHWRESLKASYPEDHRIDAAVESLKRLDSELPKYEGTPLHHKIADLCERIDAPCDIISETLRSIGFRYHPDSVGEVLEGIVEALESRMAQANEEDGNYITRLKKSRAEAMVAEAKEGFECGVLWAKDDAEWRDLVAVAKLDPNEAGVDELLAALSESYEWANHQEVVEQMFGPDVEPSDGHARGFIAGAMTVKEQVERAS